MRAIVLLLGLVLLLPAPALADSGPGSEGEGDGDDDSSGPGGGNGTSAENRSGPGNGTQDDEANDRSGPGGGNDSRGENRSGPSANGVRGNGSDDDEDDERAPSDSRWRPRDYEDEGLALPVHVEGRHLSFDLTHEGVWNLTVHGTRIGNVTAPAGTLDELRRQGSRITAEGDGFQLDARDVPRVRLEVRADTVFTDAPSTTQLPSGVVVAVVAHDDRVLLEAGPPRDALGKGPETRLETADLERHDGVRPGLTAASGGNRLGVAAPDPGVLAARFRGNVNGTEGEIGLDLALVRALLVRDTNGDGRFDVGEPAIAETLLTNGTTNVAGNAVTTTFALWSGNLTLVANLDAEKVKVTYLVDGLQAPPGTLLVLESAVDAPRGALVEPASHGVVVHQGQLKARYDVDGPVTVDGDEAWARHAVLVRDDGRIHILVYYPAGDTVVHDPVISIQSAGIAAVSAVAASPYAVLAGIVLAGALVGATFYVRRR